VAHTVKTRPTDIDLMGIIITSRDVEALAEVGFIKEGRHWVHAWGLEWIDVEVPDSALYGEDHPVEVDVGGHCLKPETDDTRHRDAVGDTTSLGHSPVTARSGVE